MRRFVLAFLKVLGTIALLFLLLVVLSGISPIYSFRSPQPFSGPDIFNPYLNLDTAQGWKRANFHTHTRVKGPWPPNECPMDAAYTDSVYKSLGYQIVTISNHNEISDPQASVYEQGYSPFKFHKLVFGGQKVNHWDPLLPVLASQMQFELERLHKDADFIQLNHPYRTVGLGKSRMDKLSGYEITELDTHVSTENEYWDWALSAGHYSFGLANDDIHHPERSYLTAIRCNFLCTPGTSYEDIKNTLLDGCYYAMRVPDYGNGNWEEKAAGNRNLPGIQNIGLKGDTIYMKLSSKADSIRINGQDHATLMLVNEADSVAYNLPANAPYARLTAFFPGGEVIYTNPFARFDSSACSGPMDMTPQKVNIPLTILFNLFNMLIGLLILALIGLIWRRKRKK